MRKLMPLKILCCVLALVLGAEAAQAAVRRSAPVRAVSPRAFSSHSVRSSGHFAHAQHTRNFGRHGLPMVAGRHGRHESRNRSAFAAIPGVFLGAGADTDVETYIDSLDTSGPLEPVAACTTSPCHYGAMSMANDGAWGGTWNYADANAARADAIRNCVERTKDRCGGIFVAAGTAWIAGLQCERLTPRGNWHWGVMALGDDLAAAIRNVYRIVAQNGFYNASECAFVAAVAADGSQLKYTRRE